MLLCNETIMTKHPDAFIKNIPGHTNTTYRLTFEQLGGSIGVWVNHLFSSESTASHHFPDCREWTTREVCFTTNRHSEKMDAFSNWGVSFFKKNESKYMCGLESTYIANIQLAIADEPPFPLSIDKNFDMSHPLITHANDPQNDTRRCLHFHSLMEHPSHPADVPLQVYTFGHFKDMLNHVTRRHPHGVPHHCLIFVERGRVLLNDTKTRIPAEHAVYIPPNVPFHYTFLRYESEQYYWVEFSGGAVQSFLSEMPLTPFTPIPLHHVPALTAHIEQMLQQPRNSAIYPYTVSSHLQLLLAELRHQLCAESDNELRRCMEAIAAQLRETTLLPSNEELATANGFSTGHFIRVFKSFVGSTPHRYALRCRLEKAKELLKNTPLNVREVAFSVGFEDPQYFSRLFRADFGVSPREYKKKVQK